MSEKINRAFHLLPASYDNSMDRVMEHSFDLTSAEKNTITMRPCSLTDGISFSKSSVFSSPTFVSTQSYGLPFKPGDQWIPYHLSYSTVCQRIETFKTFPSVTKFSALDFAKSGFYYHGVSDAVTCFFCGTTIVNWTVAECINAEHKKHSPSCW